MRMPSMYRAKELELRKRIGARLGRGKIDFSLFIEFDKGEAPAKINSEVVKGYMETTPKYFTFCIRRITQNGCSHARCDKYRS